MTDPTQIKALRDALHTAGREPGDPDTADQLAPAEQARLDRMAEQALQSAWALNPPPVNLPPATGALANIIALAVYGTTWLDLDDRSKQTACLDAAQQSRDHLQAMAVGWQPIPAGHTIPNGQRYARRNAGGDQTWAEYRATTDTIADTVGEWFIDPTTTPDDSQPIADALEGEHLPSGYVMTDADAAYVDQRVATILKGNHR